MGWRSPNWVWCPLIADLRSQLAVLNFAPAQLTVPDSVKIQNVDLLALLKTLSYHIARTERPSSRTP